MDRPAGSPPPRAPEPALEGDPAPARRPEPRQRWRIAYRRRPDAPALDQRATAMAWEATIEGTGLPVVLTERGGAPRPKLAFGAPLGNGVPAERELVEFLLVERVPVWQVRGKLELPEGHDLVDLHDVWLGAPPLPAQVAAADYRVTVAPASQLDAARLERACRDLLAAGSIGRVRTKGGGTVAYDLRPLVAGLTLRDPGPPATLAIRTRFSPALGTGRPEEVVAALAEVLGTALVVESLVRERLLLAEDLGGS